MLIDFFFKTSSCVNLCLPQPPSQSLFQVLPELVLGGRGFPGDSDSKESTCSVGDLGWEDPLEESTATLSSVLAWRIPRTEEPCGLQSMGLHRIWHDWVTKFTAHAFSTFPYSLGHRLVFLNPRQSEWKEKIKMTVIGHLSWNTVICDVSSILMSKSSCTKSSSL